MSHCFCFTTYIRSTIYKLFDVWKFECWFPLEIYKCGNAHSFSIRSLLIISLEAVWSAYYLFGLVAICSIYFNLMEYTKHFMFSLLTKWAGSLLLLFFASIQLSANTLQIRIDFCTGILHLVHILNGTSQIVNKLSSGIINTNIRKGIVGNAWINIFICLMLEIQNID